MAGKELLTLKAPEGTGSQNYSGRWNKGVVPLCGGELGMQRINQQCQSMQQLGCSKNINSRRDDLSDFCGFNLSSHHS